MAATRVAAVLISALAITLAVLWARQHPFPIYWDEAEYVNQVFDDRDALVSGGVQGAGKALLFRDNVRPPAHRLFALPLAATHRPSLQSLRPRCRSRSDPPLRCLVSDKRTGLCCATT